MPKARPLLVIGHKNPDTDSICSAIAYAELKRRSGTRARACRAGNLNDQTAFVLRHFGVPAPPLITDVHPKISDIMIHGRQLIVLDEHDTLARAQDILIRNRFTFLPVAGAGGTCAGKITALRIAQLSRDILADEAPELELALPDLAKVLPARFVAGSRSATVRGQLLMAGSANGRTANGAGNTALAITGGRATDISRLARAGVSAIVACVQDGGAPLAASARDAVKRAGASLLRTAANPLQAAMAAYLAMPVGPFLDRDHPTFRDHARVRAVQQEIARYNYGGFVITDDDNRIRGVIARDSFLNESRQPLVLVDHNEPAQAVDGIEEAEVVEIVDHHRLGLRPTDTPITFTNRTVGSTATIVGEQFRLLRIEPNAKMAGLLLAAILSDTVMLKSPTTTALDRDMVRWAAKLSGEDWRRFGTAMFAAGSSLKGRSDDELINHDRKLFTEGDVSFAISQIEVLGFKEFFSRRSRLAKALTAAAAEEGCRFACLVVTDITAEVSMLLCVGDEQVSNAITYPQVEENVFELKDVLSRKKQVLPYLLDLLRRI